MSNPGYPTAVITEMAVARISVERLTMELDALVKMGTP